MKLAYYIDSNNEKRLIRASDAQGLSNFRCPRCDEEVTLFGRYGSSQRLHFRHKWGSFAAECEAYQSQISEQQNSSESKQELCVYLHKFLNSYSLYTGFTPLKASTINESISQNISFNIDGNKEIKIDTDFLENIKLIRVSGIEQEYKLTYNKMVPYEVKEKWGYIVDGVSEKGALFYSKSYGGKKLQKGSNVITDEKYLLITADNRVPEVKGRITTFIQKLDFGISKGLEKPKYIYEIVFKDTSLTNKFFCYELDLELIDKKAVPTHIWPPIIVKNDELIFHREGDFFCTSKISEKSVENYSAKEEIAGNNYLLKNYKSMEFIRVRETEKKVQLAGVIIDEGESEIAITARNKVNIVSLKNGIPISMERVEDSSEKICRKDSIDYILNGLDVVYYRSNESSKTDIKDYSKDLELLKWVQSIKGLEADLNCDIDWILIKLKKYPKTFEEIRKYKLRGKMPVEIKRFLINNEL